MPGPGWNGVAHIGYYAWDRTTGTVGGLANLTLGTGGATSI